MKYKLNIQRDVDQDGYGDDVVYILNLPNGFRFYDDLVHTRGYDTMAELKLSVKNDIIPCDCKGCKIKVQPKFDLNAPYNKEFLGAQPARACEDY